MKHQDIKVGGRYKFIQDGTLPSCGIASGDIVKVLLVRVSVFAWKIVNTKGNMSFCHSDELREYEAETEFST